MGVWIATHISDSVGHLVEDFPGYYDSGGIATNGSAWGSLWWKTRYVRGVDTTCKGFQLQAEMASLNF